MTTFHIITVLPELFEPYLGESILGRAIKSKLVRVKIYDLRSFTRDKHRKVDDKPYGGGPGMIISVEPLVQTLRKILKGKSKNKIKIVITAPAGRQFSNKTAQSLASRYKDIVIIAGRYEGLDERIIKILKSKNGFGAGVEEVSVGPYVLTGGELPALVIIDAVARHIDGVLGKAESLEEKRLGVGVPVYTRPENFKFLGRDYKVPSVLLSGNHRRIEIWRRENRKTG
ncbi:MAG: tRNA (guanosine(37)-N1)-methyltransferase TrmD [Candidatus Colwellbacteria bacterium]|nr:tRNA (guanosine(37)-N1)-methyltransferase TrmD [Candidatus Colwellbacteria bacterium]